MTRVADRIYTASELSGSARREFIDEAQRDSARLRTTSGESLVMLREAKSTISLPSGTTRSRTSCWMPP